MNAERWKQIDELFDAALDLPEAEREGFLSERCEGDDRLKNEVLSLLRAGSAASNKFMENSAMRIAAKNLAGEQEVTFKTLQPDEQIGIYKIERLLGAGGMGEVYLAHDPRLNRKVALKLLPAEFTADAERVKRFEREARAVSALNHPYIVTVYDVGNTNGDGNHSASNYIAAEYIEGETVRDLINRGGVDLKQTLSIISQLCEALAAAHKAGIIHRDIKPENIMIRPDGYVKVLDFGLAKLTEHADFQHGLSNYTQKGIIIGTPAYMSPEQISDDYRLDHRTDLWSVGVVLYEMLTGVNPFKGENRQATFQKILSDQPPLVSELKPDLPAELDRILEKALEKDADLSYQTASDIRADLKRVRREIDSSPSLRSGSVAEKRRKNAATAGGFSLLTFSLLLLPLLFVLGLGIWFFVIRPTEPEAIDWTKATNVHLTDNQGTEYFPSLAPDGKSFVYASDAGGNFDIYIQRVGSKKADNLTADSPSNDTTPAFSPNGERIAFRSEREPRGIYVMEAGGENLRRIADFGFHPSWSPDGKEIVVSTFGRDQPTVYADGEQGLWIINVDSGAKRELIRLGASFPAWSPSGKRVAYWFYDGTTGNRHIATVSADGGGEPIVVAKDFAVSNWNPVWSPDGGFLYFVSSRGGNMNFWRVRIDEATGEVLSEPQPVVAPSKFSRHLNFSRDGKRMIYVQTNNQSNIQAAGFDPKTEKITDEPFWITQGNREIARAELSPDGTRFQMRLVKQTQDDLVSVSREGRDWRDVTNDAPFDRYSRWSPDGKKIAFGSDRTGLGNVWICNSDGTNLRQITFSDDSRFVQGFPMSFPVWSPDGKQLAFHHNQTTYFLDLDRPWNEQMPAKLPPTENGGFIVVWDWSPDGKKLVGVIAEGDKRFIGFYSFETNRYEKIIENANEIPSWLPDSRRFVYAVRNKIFLADNETKKPREILSSPALQLRAPFVARDGRLLYYTAYSAESDIWLLDASNTAGSN